jgi:hypothetical protein
MRTLFIIPLVLMSLVSFPSSSVLAKEYVMSCNFGAGLFTFKLTDKPFDKNLYLRTDGEWKNHCDGADRTFTHNQGWGLYTSDPMGWGGPCLGLHKR